MLALLLQWYRRRFSDPEAIALLVILLSAFVILFFFGKLLAPLLVALIFAYLLEWPTSRLERAGLSRTLSTSIVIIFFMGMLLLVVLVVAPIVWQQGVNLLNDLPTMMSKLYHFSNTLPERFPFLANAGVIDVVVDNIRSRLSGVGESVLRYSLASLIGLMTLAVYLVLVPMILFFLLKDKTQMIEAVRRFLPKNRNLAVQVWGEMNQQIINYIRGKAIEMLVVGVVTWLAFVILGLNYALLLSVLVGLSVLIPYIGALVVTVPVVCVGLFQWGPHSDFWMMLVIYFIIQALDGNLLVPVLFSEAVNLHPLVIILSVVIFGGLWGFWGVFFAIPLATLVKAVIHAWPDPTHTEGTQKETP